MRHNFTNVYYCHDDKFYTYEKCAEDSPEKYFGICFSDENILKNINIIKQDGEIAIEIPGEFFTKILQLLAEKHPCPR